MKKSRVSESQIVAILKEVELGAKVGDSTHMYRFAATKACIRRSQGMRGAFQNFCDNPESFKIKKPLIPVDAVGCMLNNHAVTGGRGGGHAVVASNL